jgi:hypothetical protein
MCHIVSRQLDATKMRQRQFPDPSVDDCDEWHERIPRDADGFPVYFILPAERQAQYDERMAACEAGWRDTRDPAFVGEATFWGYAYRQPAPSWLSDAVMMLAIEWRGQAHAARRPRSIVRLQRYRAVCDARQRGLSWTRAYEDAVARLEGTDARGETATMKDDYCTVQADLKAGRIGVFEHPLLPNKETRQRLGDAARQKPSPR